MGRQVSNKPFGVEIAGHYGLIDQKLVKTLEEVGLLVVFTNIDINLMKILATTSILESTSNFEK